MKKAKINIKKMKKYRRKDFLKTKQVKNQKKIVKKSLQKMKNKKIKNKSNTSKV
jgi:hypothetical protein